MTKQVKINEELNAYIDGRLDQSSREALELSLSDDEKIFAAQCQEDNERLKAHLSSLLKEPIPPYLETIATHPPVKSSKRFSFTDSAYPFQQLVAGLVIIVIGGAMGWGAKGLVDRPIQITPLTTDHSISAVPLAQRALAAHVVYTPDIKRPVEVTADQANQLVNWLSNRMGEQISPPDLESHGYHLMGGRLLPDSARPAAQFMYDNPEGKRITLYVTHEIPANYSEGFQFLNEGAYTSFYWVKGNLGYALSGDISKKELADLSVLIYQNGNTANK